MVNKVPQTKDKAIKDCALGVTPDTYYRMNTFFRKGKTGFTGIQDCVDALIESLEDNIKKTKTNYSCQ